uniref:Uncharacterized protein n=1 Tax=Clytia hemisphaerica TaxID=252671 RepID=A0A7M6DP38_9CNID
MMEDNTPYRTSKYIFMKRDMNYFETHPEWYKKYIFRGVESDDPWDAFDCTDDHMFMFEDLFRGLWEKGSFVLLHPKKVEQCLEFERAWHETEYGRRSNFSTWSIKDIPSDFHEPGFAMMVGVLNKISL